jgi:peroxiredoxin
MPVSTWCIPFALAALLAAQAPADSVHEARISADSLAHATATATERAAIDTLPQPAADFLLQDLDGVPRRFLGYPGRVHLLVYWSPECPECVREMPRLARLYARDRGRGLAVVSVTNPQLRDKAAVFAREKSLGFPVLLDEHGLVARLYKVRMTPTVWVVRGGLVVWSHAGFDPAAPDSLGPAVEALLGE